MNSLLTSFKLVAKIVGIQEVWRERILDRISSSNKLLLRETAWLRCVCCCCCCCSLNSFAKCGGIFWCPLFQWTKS